MFELDVGTTFLKGTIKRNAPGDVLNAHLLAIGGLGYVQKVQCLISYVYVLCFKFCGLGFVFKRSFYEFR